MSDQTYRVNVDLVNILCSVFDKNTNAFLTISRRMISAFMKIIRNRRLKTSLVKPTSPSPLAMLIDTSASVGPKLKFEQEAAPASFRVFYEEG